MSGRMKTTNNIVFSQVSFIYNGINNLRFTLIIIIIKIELLIFTKIKQELTIITWRPLSQ